MENKKFIYNNDIFISMHRFGNVLDCVLNFINIENVKTIPDLNSRDSIGRHWYGSRLHVMDKVTGNKFYLHIGLIYLPDTKIGLMVEVDKNSNNYIYQSVWDNISDGETYRCVFEEKDYLKLFYKDDKFLQLYTSNNEEQITKLRIYIEEAIKNIVNAGKNYKIEPFRINTDSLKNYYNITFAFEDAINSFDVKGINVEIEHSRDNFGSYAEGFRLWARKNGIELYVYFGAIYSFEKDPKGIFSEIDWLNNKKYFHNAFKNLASDEIFYFSKNEPKFIKMFMENIHVEKLNKKDYKEQVNQLKLFLEITVVALFDAIEKN